MTLRVYGILLCILVGHGADLPSAKGEVTPPSLRKWIDWIREVSRMSDDNLDYQEFFNWYAREYYEDADSLAMCSAIERGDLLTIDRLLTNGLDIDRRGHGGMTFLLYSLMWPPTTTRHLIRKGADPTIPLVEPRDSAYVQRLGSAIRIVARWGDPETLSMILDQGRSPRMLCWSDTTEYWPLLSDTYENTRNLELLLKRGADPNLLSANRHVECLSAGMPPDALRLLLNAGADYRICTYRCFLLELAQQKDARKGSSAWRPIYEFIEKRERIDLIELLAKYDSCVKETGKEAAMRSPARWLPPEKDRADRFFGDANVRSLIGAIEDNDVERIEQHVRAGTDVNAQGKGGVTPLFWATAAEIKTFAKLLELGGNPNAALTAYFRTPSDEYLGESDTLVSWAACYGTAEHLQLVLDHGGNPGIRNPNSGRTLLFDIWGRSRTVVRYSDDPNKYAQMQRAIAERKLEMLLKDGHVSLNAQERLTGRTLAMISYPSWLATRLVQNGADCGVIDNQGYDLMLVMLRELRFVLTSQTSSRESARTRIAWRKDRKEIVEAIERRGGDFAIAERIVWRDNGDSPSCDLHALGRKDRPWLPQK